MVEGCPRQIAVIEGCAGQVGAGEICFLEIAIGEFCVFQVQSLEVGEFQHALVELEFQQQFSAIAELQAQQLGVCEADFLKSRFVQLCKAQIAAVERAVSECDSGKVGVVQVAVDEPALLVNLIGRVLFTESDVLENFVFNNLVVLSFHV